MSRMNDSIRQMIGTSPSPTTALRTTRALRVLLVAAVFGGTIVGGCGGGGEKEQAAKQAPAPAVEAPKVDKPAPQPAKQGEEKAPDLATGPKLPGAKTERKAPAHYFSMTPDSVVAVVGERSITMKEVDEFSSGMIQSLERKYKGEIPPDLLYERRYASLERMITEALLLDEAKKRGIAATDDEVSQLIKNAESKQESPAMFQESLARQGMTMEQYRERLYRQITIRSLSREMRDNSIKDNDPAIASFYEANKHRYEQPEMVQISQIYLRVTPESTADQKAEVKKEAERLLKEIKGGGDFNALAEKHSQDPSARRGGKLSWVRRGQMPMPVEEAAFSQKPGQVSDVIESPLGYHILRTDERRAAGTQPLEEVKTSIMRHLQNENYQRWTTELREKAQVQIKM